MDIQQIYIIIKILALSWFITSFKPIHTLFEYKSLLKWPFLYIIMDTIHEVCKCMKCFSFWLALIVTQSFWIAILVSFISYVYVMKISTWIENLI